MKINSVKDGEGLWAYIMLHQWYTRLYARKTLQWLDAVEEKDIVAEMEVGHVSMTAMEGILVHLSMERANDMQVTAMSRVSIGPIVSDIQSCWAYRVNHVKACLLCPVRHAVSDNRACHVK